MRIESKSPRFIQSRYRHIYLLTSLLLVIVVEPFLVDRVLGIWVIDAFLFISLLAGAYATAAGRHVLFISGALAITAMLARVTWLLQGSEMALFGYLVAYFAFYAIVASSLLRFLFRTQAGITADTIYCALSVYLILGLLWTIAYVVLESAVPGSFRFGIDDATPESNFQRLIGFSFITLTTLGYGNIAPATPGADALAALEAIVGQFYIAIVIARLVALQITQRDDMSEARD